MLVVHRVTERLLSVRLESGAEAAVLPLEPDQYYLDVVSAVGSTSLLPGTHANPKPDQTLLSP